VSEAHATSLPGGVRLHAAPGGFPVFAAFGAAGVAAAFAVRLLHLDRLGFSLCMFKALTGIPCMTCGTTRTLGLLAHGDAAGAFAMNPLVAAAAAILAVLAVADLAGYAARGRVLSFSASPGAARALRIMVPVALLVNWIYLIAAGR
jgi:hypothetical protein